MDLAKEITFFIKKPLVVIVSSENKEVVFKVLNFLKGKRVRFRLLPFESAQNLDSLAAKSKRVIFIVDKIEGKVRTHEFVRRLREKDILIFNFDDGEARELGLIHKGRSLSYGFLQASDMTISDLAGDEAETNFKIDFEGHIIPVWLQGSWTKKQVAVIAAATICVLEFGLNLVEISQQLKNFSLE